MPIPRNPTALLPIDPLMFPDSFSFSVSAYPAGTHGGSTPVPGTPVTVLGYAEKVAVPSTLDNPAAGQPLGRTGYSLFFRDAGTGVAPVACKQGDEIRWTAHAGVSLAVPRVLIATADAEFQDPVWLVECWELG